MGDFFQAIGNFFSGGPEVPEYTPPPAPPAPAPTQPASPNYEALYRNQVTAQMAKEKAAATATAVNKGGRRGTLLTGPRGVSQDQPVGTKSLLGQ